MSNNSPLTLPKAGHPVTIKRGLFENFDELMHRNYQRFLEELMLYERQQFLNAAPYQRHEGRADQAKGFYTRSLVPHSGYLDRLHALL